MQYAAAIHIQPHPHMHGVAGLTEEGQVPFPLVYGGLPIAPDGVLANRADEQA